MKLETALKIAKGEIEADEKHRQWAMNVMAGWIERERAYKKRGMTLFEECEGAGCDNSFGHTIECVRRRGHDVTMPGRTLPGYRTGS